MLAARPNHRSVFVDSGKMLANRLNLRLAKVGLLVAAAHHYELRPAIGVEARE